jgi:CheY-like chemotaxis protein
MTTSIATSTPAFDTFTRAKVLLVDDDSSVLAGLRRQLFGKYTVHLAEGGPEGLEVLAAEGPFAVVVSDMRMPGMDGAAFLSGVRDTAPDTIRVLLTGYTDVAAAIRAINEGQVFRFLTKPCSHDILNSCLKDAVAQYALVHAERELLDKTLRGAVGALFECLQLADPVAFARAGRVRTLVVDLCAQLALTDTWHIEVAAMLYQLGSVTLPPDTATRLRLGGRLNNDDEEMIRQFPRIASGVIAGIPRLDPVRDILHKHVASWSTDSSMPIGAAILRLALDAETRETQRLSPLAVHAALSKDQGRYAPQVLDAYRQLAATGYAADVTPVMAAELHVGMVLADDVHATTGQLLIGRGTQIGETSLERLRNYARHTGIIEPLLVESDSCKAAPKRLSPGDG